MAKLEIDNDIQNGPKRNRNITDCIFCILMILFWAFSVFILIYGYEEGDPIKLTQIFDYKGTPCGKEIDGTDDYEKGFFYQPLGNFGQIVCVKECP